MDISGYVVLGVVTLFFLYVMPQLIRNRQDVVDARVADRFSADLRILVTAGTVGSGAATALDDAPRAYLHDPRLRTEVSDMNRPPALVNPKSPSPSRGTASAPQPAAAGRARTDAARADAARAEAWRRRRAAARRRLALTVILFLASAGAWGLVAMQLATWVAGAVPSFLLLVVLVLGRRAAIAGRRAEQAARARQQAAPASAPAKAVSAAATPAREAARSTARTADDEAITELIPRLEALRRPGLVWQGEPTELDVDAVPDGAVPIGDAPVRRTFEPAEGSAWTPVPVPAPTYTLKPAAPRMDAAPLVVEAPAQEDEDGAAEAEGGRPLDLDAVLARRRAAGE